jgi:hypothetical protein
MVVTLLYFQLGLSQRLGAIDAGTFLYNSVKLYLFRFL